MQWLGDEHTLFPQAGDNLGERMKNAFEMVFSQGLDQRISSLEVIARISQSFIDRGDGSFKRL